MEHSASAPAVNFVPNYPVVKTGPGPRETLGRFSKDTGEYSSRINQIVKAAGKFNTGPGKYIGPDDYADPKFRPHSVHAFAKSSREYKPMHKGPAPHHYEAKSILMGDAISCKSNLSNRPRVLLGKVPTGKKRSFLDQAEAHGKQVPGPGYVTPKHVCSNKLDSKLAAPTLADNRKNKSIAAKGPAEPGPGQYTPGFNQTEERMVSHSVPKEKAKNFLDKAVRAAALDGKGTPSPGPGHHNNHTIDSYKLSRGTKYCQLRGIGRSPCSGYF
jgi:hypothetical protein